MSDPIYLLDTNILMALISGRELGRYIDEEYGLRGSRQRPLISIVSHGELWVLARRNGWGASKCASLQTMLANLVTVPINHPAVIEAYVDFDVVSQAHPQGARNMGKNDLWIAAAARASGATLLTTDKDFDHLIPDHLAGAIIDTTVPGGSPSATRNRRRRRFSKVSRS